MIIGILLIFIDKKQIKQLVYTTVIKENTSVFTCNKQKQAYTLAKSILRFNETSKGEKSEYVLTGTLLSLAIALCLGILALKITIL